MSSIVIESMWYMAPTIVAICIALSKEIIGLFKCNLKHWMKQLISWVVSIVVSIGSIHLGFVNVGEPAWVSQIVFAAIVSLSSNGIYEIQFIKEFVNKFPTLNSKKNV